MIRRIVEIEGAPSPIFVYDNNMSSDITDEVVEREG